MNCFAHAAFALALLVPIIPSAAQEINPLLRVPVAAERISQDLTAVRWQAGPLRLALPPSWVASPNQARSTFDGPNDTKAIVLALHTTPEAQRAGYSVLLDRQRGPSAFAADLSECAQFSQKAPVRLESDGRSIVYVECLVPDKGRRLVFVQAIVYSASYLLNVHVIGERSSVDEFTKALKSHGWSET